MPVHKIDPIVFADFRTATIGLWTDSVTRLTVTATEARAVLVGAARNDPVQVAVAATKLLQAKLDVRIPLVNLSTADPDKTINPNRPDLFWDGADMVGRAVRVTITWTGTTYQLECERTN